MGLLDWLNEGIGSMGGGASPSSAAPPMPPMQDPGSSPGMMSGAPPMPPTPAPPTVGDAGPMSPSLPPPPPPMPPAASEGSGGDMLPPAATATAGLLPPAPPLASSGPQGMIGRALGLDRNAAKTISGSLASGLKSVGDNVHKPGLAAFAGSAGSALEGGNSADDKISDQQTKYLTQAIAAAKSGNESALNVARTRLAVAQAKAAEEGDSGKTDLNVARTRLATAQARKLEDGGGTTKASVVNSPEQLYLRAVGATNSDGKLSLLKNAYIQAAKDGQQDSPAAKAAKQAYEKAYDETRDGHLKTLGVDPKIASTIGKKPGFSADNPVPKDGLTREKFNALPVGAYFVNPADGRLLIKQPPAGATPPAAASSGTSPVPPAPPVTAPADSSADEE